MNSLNSLAKTEFKNTYEVESKQYKSDYNANKTEENNPHKIIQEGTSQSPPIILCEAGDFRNSRTHRHRYLFYPSISRLSPYGDDTNFSNLNLMNKTSRLVNNYFDLVQEINKLRDKNRLTKEEYEKRVSELNNEENNYETNRNKKRPESANYIRNTGKYKDLLEKSNDLMNSISNLVKEEEGKIRGPLGYYNKNKEYDEFVKRQKNLFNTYNNNNNINNNERNNNNSSYNQNRNNTQDKSGTLWGRGRFGISSGNNYYNNRDYNDNDNQQYSNNNKRNNQDYNDNNGNINMKNNIKYNNNDAYLRNTNEFNNNRTNKNNNTNYNKNNNLFNNNNNRFNRSNENKNYNNNRINLNDNDNKNKNNNNNLKKSYSDRNDIYYNNRSQDYTDRNDIYNNNNNNRNSNYNDRNDIYKNNNRNQDYNDRKDIYNNNNRNQDYNDRRDIYNNSNRNQDYNDRKDNNNRSDYNDRKDIYNNNRSDYNNRKDNNNRNQDYNDKNDIYNNNNRNSNYINRNNNFHNNRNPNNNIFQNENNNNNERNFDDKDNDNNNMNNNNFNNNNDIYSNNNLGYGRTNIRSTSDNNKLNNNNNEGLNDNENENNGVNINNFEDNIGKSTVPNLINKNYILDNNPNLKSDNKGGISKSVNILDLNSNNQDKENNDNSYLKDNNENLRNQNQKRYENNHNDLDNNYNNIFNNKELGKKGNNYNNINNIINSGDEIISHSEKDEEGSGKDLVLVLSDENNNVILSEDQKPFTGEKIQEKKIKGDKISVITKGGEDIVLDYLKNNEGDFLTNENGYPILGKGNNYFFDKNEEIIISSDKNILKEDKSIPVKSQKANKSILFVTFKSNGEFDTMKTTQQFDINTMGPGGAGTTGYRKKYLTKTRFKQFPKGDGDAKPPIIRKKKRKFKK